MRALKLNRRGFTLLELIVALAMVAVIASSLYAAVRVAYKAQASAEAAVEPARVADVTFMMLRADIENAIPPGVLAQAMVGTNTSGNSGDADELDFYTTAPSPEHDSANGEIKEVDLVLGQPQNSTITEQCLLRRVNRNLLTSDTPVYDEQILARGVTGFNLRYWTGTDWEDDFDGSTQSDNPLPAAVEVTLDLDQNGKQLRFVRVFRILCSTVTPSTGAQ